MRIPLYSRQFEKDLKRMLKQGKNFEKIKIIIRSILAEEILDPIHKDHKLIGNMQEEGSATSNRTGFWFTKSMEIMSYLSGSEPIRIYSVLEIAPLFPTFS